MITSFIRVKATRWRHRKQLELANGGAIDSTHR